METKDISDLIIETKRLLKDFSSRYEMELYLFSEKAIGAQDALLSLADQVARVQACIEKIERKN